MRLNIKWSKQKKRIENNFCNSLNKRVSINLTHYRAVHEPESRYWITLDGKEIFSISKIQWLNEWGKIRKDYRECDGAENEFDYATKVMKVNGDYYIDDIQDSLEQFSNLSIKDALISSNFITKALSMIDKRVGKSIMVPIGWTLEKNVWTIGTNLIKSTIFLFLGT